MVRRGARKFVAFALKCPLRRRLRADLCSQPVRDAEHLGAGSLSGILSQYTR